ncbi:MAG: GIY-YIG nuclease family protein [Ignavibacteria bacterium]|jgi:hypothetical protein|nr:GIY-YIG nuclease family protein [Ignavibacteria bacterium]
MKTKKEMRQEYKQRKFRMGVFQIRNLSNGKVFISGSVNLDAIWNRHKFQLEMGSHPNRDLQTDWNSSGADNFVFEILDEIKPSDDLAIDNKKETDILEEMIIEKIQPFGERGYNRVKVKK